MNEKQAEIIRAGIEGAMQEAKAAASEVRHLAGQVAAIGRRVQSLSDQMDADRVHVTTCPNCGHKVDL